MVTNNREYSICVGSPSDRYQSKIKKLFSLCKKRAVRKKRNIELFVLTKCLKIESNESLVNKRYNLYTMLNSIKVWVERREREIDLRVFSHSLSSRESLLYRD